MTKEQAFELAAAIYATHSKLRPEPYTIGNGESVVRLRRKWGRNWVVVCILWEWSDWDDYLESEKRKGSVAA